MDFATSARNVERQQNVSGFASRKCQAACDRVSHGRDRWSLPIMALPDTRDRPPYGHRDAVRQRLNGSAGRIASPVLEERLRGTRARPLQVVQQAGHGVRVVEGLGRRRAASAATSRARPPGAGCPAGRSRRPGCRRRRGRRPGRPARSSASPEEASANGTPG